MNSNASKPFSVQQSGMVVSVGPDGEWTGPGLTGRCLELKASTGLQDCTVVDAKVGLAAGRSGVVVEKHLVHGPSGRSCTLTETLVPTGNSIRWHIRLVSPDEAWTTHISSCVSFADPSALRFWAPWASPQDPDDGYHVQRDETDSDDTIVPRHWSPRIMEWTDPLVAMPFSDRRLCYGAHVYEEEDPGLGFVPFHRDIFSVPLFTAMRVPEDLGLSFVFSPEDPLFDATMTTTREGDVVLSRLHHRLGGGRSVEFAVDIVLHEADWRGGLRWMADRYPSMFQPENPYAGDVSGCGAYSASDVDFDAAKMKRMGFGVNWKASFDFPYMGMFLPPVADETEWVDLKNERTSIAKMREYSSRLRQAGFRVLNYFNVTEFGTGVKFPLRVDRTTEERDLWKDGTAFLERRLKSAVLLAPDTGTPYFTWLDSVAMDPGDATYQEFLLDQARSHVAKFPDSSGICIDRMDWLRLYNDRRDDGVSMLGGKKVHSLYVSWAKIMDRLAPIFHDAGKVVFCNNHVKRLDLLKHIDGIFDEFTFGGMALNSTAFLCLMKPFLGWVDNRMQILSDPDAFFQRQLYLGSHPMAPLPGNDHAMGPDEEVERLFFDYGPMLDAIRGRTWVLEPHAVRVAGGLAKANAFATKDGYAVPVVFGGTADCVEVDLALLGNLQGGADRYGFSLLHPGREGVLAVEGSVEKDALRLRIPLVRGCAMLLLRRNHP